MPAAASTWTWLSVRAPHRAGVALVPLSAFRHPAAPAQPPLDPALAVGYGTPPERACTAALDGALCGALARGCHSGGRL
ncbi:hypothetical protein [Streptomyces qinglanensis]|uniref:hypothetical protein n=1 Tax=Streptomyces qinglanensis TaxID=943816 RepID=UPI003D72CD3D